MKRTAGELAGRLFLPSPFGSVEEMEAEHALLLLSGIHLPRLVLATVTLSVVTWIEGKPYLDVYSYSKPWSVHLYYRSPEREELAAEHRYHVQFRFQLLERGVPVNSSVVSVWDDELIAGGPFGPFRSLVWLLGDWRLRESPDEARTAALLLHEALSQWSIPEDRLQFRLFFDQIAGARGMPRISQEV